MMKIQIAGEAAAKAKQSKSWLSCQFRELAGICHWTSPQLHLQDPSSLSTPADTQMLSQETNAFPNLQIVTQSTRGAGIQPARPKVAGGINFSAASRSPAQAS